MDKNVKKININDLYKTLKKRDLDILKHFENRDISHIDYFFYGINSDIVSNALNIIINYLCDNLESAGVDISCRSIIEAMVILKMDASGDISDEQKKIYRYLYSYVELHNFQSISKVTNEDLRANKETNLIAADEKRATRVMCKHFNCTPNDLKKLEISADDPCFYLKKTLDDKIDFSTLLKKYPIANEETIKMYEFFSMFIHPRCEMDLEIEESIMEMRQLYIEDVLIIVFNYLQSCGLLANLDDTNDFNDDFFNNPLLTFNIMNINGVNKSMDVIIDKLCMLPDGVDWFSLQFLYKMKYIIVDMMTSLSMGYKEHVISLFKSFVEEYSVFYEVNSFHDIKEFNTIKKAYWCTSRIQLEDYFASIGLSGKAVPEEVIKELYNDYYKEKYGLNNYNKFYWSLRKNSLYFLTKERKSYNKIVNKCLEYVFCNKKIKYEDAKTTYKVAKDIGHASGYSFNATMEMVDVYSQKTLLYTWEMMVFFILNASLTLSEHNIDANVEPIIKIFKELIDIQNKEIERIYNSQKH